MQHFKLTNYNRSLTHDTLRFTFIGRYVGRRAHMVQRTLNRSFPGVRPMSNQIQDMCRARNEQLRKLGW